MPPFDEQELPPGAVIERDLPPGATVEIAPDPSTVAAFERAPGIPLYQVMPGVQPQKELPPLTWTEALVTNPAKQIGSGLMTGSAAANRLTANIAGLLDAASQSIADMTGTEKGGLFKQIEEWARQQQAAQEQQAAELTGGRNDLASQVYRGGAAAAASLPAYAVASSAGGPIGGMAMMGALETADQGWENMLKGTAEGALMGKFLQVVGPGGRLVRIPAVAAATYTNLVGQGVDPQTAFSHALTMGGLSGMHKGGPSALPPEKPPFLDRVMDILPERLPQSMRIQSQLNPVEQKAIDYFRGEKIPLTTYGLTGNKYAQAMEATTAHTPLGAQQAREFQAGTQEAMQGKAEQLAGAVYPKPVSPYEGGKAAADVLDKQIAELGNKAEGEYTAAWQHKGKPEFTKRVAVRTKVEPVFDEAGEPTGQRRVPVYKNVNMPVDVRWMKQIAKEELPKYEFLPAAEQSQSAAYSVYKRILKGDDYITAEQAEEALKGLKAESRKAESPELRDAAQGAAANLIPRLQKAIDAAVGETGSDAVAGLQAGRKTHAQKMEIADIARKLREEPVQAFRQLSMSHDAGVDYLKEIAKRAPDVMPKLGRAYLDHLFELATQEGGWMRALGILREWHNLGPQTKALMFPDATQRQALDRFFLASKLVGERINPSGTTLVREAKEAGINPFKWAQGYVGGKLFYTPRGIKFLTGIAQDPPRTATESARVKAQAAKIFGPPEEPPEETPPTGGDEPPGGGGGGGGQTPSGSAGGGTKQGVPDWTREHVDREHEAAKKLGIVDDIERLSAEGNTAADIVSILSDKLRRGTLGPQDAKAMVRAVRAKLGIPGLDTDEFADWQKEYRARQIEGAEEESPKPGFVQRVKDLFESEEGSIGRRARDPLAAVSLRMLMQEPLTEGTGTKTVDVARAIRQQARRSGGSLAPGSSENVRLARAIAAMHDDLDYALASQPEARKWYTGSVADMEKQLIQRRPEFKDPAKMSLFKYLLGVTSNGVDPETNFDAAMRGWDLYKQHGRFMAYDPGRVSGLSNSGQVGLTFRANSYETAMKRLDKLVAQKGEAGAVEWLKNKQTIAELKKYDPTITVGDGSDRYGSYVLGEKVGSFGANLNGIYSELTADKWWSRTWNRWMGTTIATNREGVFKYDKEGEPLVQDDPRNETERNLMRKAASEVAGNLGLTVAELQAVLWYAEQALYRAHGLQAASMDYANAARNYFSKTSSSPSAGPRSAPSARPPGTSRGRRP